MYIYIYYIIYLYGIIKSVKWTSWFCLLQGRQRIDTRPWFQPGMKLGNTSRRSGSLSTCAISKFGDCKKNVKLYERHLNIPKHHHTSV